MLAAKVQYLTSALTFITLIVVVHSRGHTLLRIMSDIEDLRIHTTDMNDDYGGLGRFMELVRSIKSNAKDLGRGGFWSLEHRSRLPNDLTSKMPNINTRRPPRNELYSSVALEGIDALRRRFAYRSTQNEPVHFRGNEWAIASCEGISQYENENLHEQTITINHVCSSLHSCANVARPYQMPGNNRRDDDLTKACTADHKCDVVKALPLMTALFYSKVYEAASHFQCSRMVGFGRTGANNWRYIYRTLEELKQEADVLVAYAYSHPEFWKTHWRTFFRDVISNNAHLEIDLAVSMMKEKRYDFEILRVACKVLQFAEACEFEDIYKQYQVIEKNRQNRNSPKYVKDLRLHHQIDHAKLVELQKIKLMHVKTLGAVRDLDDNLQASISGISKYFGELARFDQGIADADAAFISAELEKYTTTLTDVQDKLTDDLHEAMSYMMAVLTARVAEKAIVLGMKIVSNTNPLKLLFTGPDLADIASLANEVADAGADLAKGAALIASLTELADDSEKFADAFIGNSEQLSTVKNLKNQILAGRTNSLNEDADKFLEQYSAYTPQTDRSSLARNDALWSAYKDATCDFLSTDSGVASAIPKGIAGAKLLCERLEGTLAQFFTLREDIFDFQFQLIDAMASIVRGNLARRLAENIQGHGDIMSGAQLLTTSFLAQSDLQTVASIYCDIIEYKQLGQPFSGCATFHGLFSNENLEALIAYNPSSITHHEVERFVTIPTQPSHPGDTAYIDLNALARQNDVVFHIPKNRTWLEDNRWTIPGQRETEVPFVKEFEIYLPHKSYESGSIPTSSTMEITIKSIAGSFVSTLNPNTGIAYLLPRGSATYLTSYEDNYSSCSKEIKKTLTVCATTFLNCVSCRPDIPDKMLCCRLSSQAGVSV